jgi:hypothetical protein
MIVQYSVHAGDIKHFKAEAKEYREAELIETLNFYYALAVDSKTAELVILFRNFATGELDWKSAYDNRYALSTRKASSFNHYWT